MITYGLEYSILPLCGIFFFATMTGFSWPGVLLNNAVLTFISAMGAHWRSKQLAKLYYKRDSYDRLEPMWPALLFLMLVYLTALQLIAAVAHVSYNRNGPLVPDLFDRQ